MRSTDALADEGLAPTPAAKTLSVRAVHVRVRTALARVDPLLVAVVVLAAVLRFVQIGAESLWYDELSTLQVVDRPFIDVFQAVANREGAPPLYYVLLWGWQHVAGTSDGALRSLSAIVGVATVPVVYAFAREVKLAHRSSLIAALIVATNPWLIWYSREARAYSLLVLLASLSLLFAVRARSKRSADLFAWALFGAAAIATHYFAAVLVAIEVVWLVVAVRVPLRRLAAPLSIVLVTVVGAVALATAQQSSGRQDWIADFPLGTRLEEAARVALMGPSAPEAWLWVPGAMALGLALLFLALFGRPDERRAGFAMLGLAAVVFFAPVIATPDYFLGRNAIVVIVPASVFVAAGLGVRRLGWAGPALACALCAVFVYIVVSVTATSALQRAPWERIARAIEATPEKQLVLVMGDEGHLAQPILRYLDGAHVVGSSEVTRTRDITLVLNLPGQTACGRWSGLACELVLLPTLPDALEGGFELVGEARWDGFSVAHYRSQEPVDVERKTLAPLDEAFVVVAGGHRSG